MNIKEIEYLIRNYNFTFEEILKWHKIFDYVVNVERESTHGIVCFAIAVLKKKD